MNYLGVKELSEYLKISTSKAYALMNLPSFPPIKIGRDWRVSQDALDRFLKQQEGREIHLYG